MLLSKYRLYTRIMLLKSKTQIHNSSFEKQSDLHAILTFRMKKYIVLK